MASEKADEFRRVYGPAGAWAELFAREIGFLGTELLQSSSQPGIFVTMDSWDSAEAWAAFLRAWGDDYTTLDHRTQSLATSEDEIGAFEGGFRQRQVT